MEHMMDKKHFDKAWRNASVQEIRSSTLILEQYKDHSGVCIIPKKQDTAARAILAHLGRSLVEITGTRKGDLQYSFAPPLTEEEVEALSD